jgi:tRNA nucleotidyltransferase (CCA-adding enzyme)
MDKGAGMRVGLDQKIRDLVLNENSPSSRERSIIEKTSLELIKKVKEAISSIGLKDVEPMMTGSVAKGTMTKDPDLDLFLLFPRRYPEKDMEKLGMKIGKIILQSFHAMRSLRDLGWSPLWTKPHIIPGTSIQNFPGNRGMM